MNVVRATIDTLAHMESNPEQVAAKRGLRVEILG